MTSSPSGSTKNWPQRACDPGSAAIALATRLRLSRRKERRDGKRDNRRTSDSEP
jgi:hypothetical protein